MNGGQMKWERDDEKQKMEDKHKGQQVKESAEVGDTRRKTGKEKHLENRTTLARMGDTTSQTGRQIRRDQ